MKAVIMAGGKGTRLLSLTNDEIPKPMAPVAGKPILHWQIEKLKENGWRVVSKEESKHMFSENGSNHH